MANTQRTVGTTMRPNIQISHALNGRVKDYAADNGMATAEAYQQLIETGLEKHE